MRVLEDRQHRVAACQALELADERLQGPLLALLRAEIERGKPLGVQHPHSVKQHTAFVAVSRSEVDAFYEAALSAGGRDNGPPGLRTTEAGYPPGYYAAFVLDPDDNNIEAVFRS
jgi:catechol 2,3-dioxygenase-like lactoylglutathione lyase family enzyme